MSTQALEVPKKPSGSESALVPTTPMELLAIAVSNNFDIDKLGKLMELQERWQANQAKQAFEDAMAAFKSEPITITRDKDNRQYESKYTSIGNLVETVTPFLSRHGLSAAWDIAQGEKIKVTCTITHRQGHSRSTSMEVPPDNSGSKNLIQQIKSSITYARICTFECAIGLASRDPQVNRDDDGNGVAEGEGLSDERFVYLKDGIANCCSLDELKAVYRAACKEADEANDASAKREFNTAKNSRYKELFNAGR